MRGRELEQSVMETVKKPQLDRTTVIEACHRLSEYIASGYYGEALRNAGAQIPKEAVMEASRLLNRDVLRRRVERELEILEGKRIMPLGVLLHIGASNMDGLSAYSVVEGLLTGNVNLLKLPEGDNGISTFLLRELVRTEPALREYIHVFRIPSEDEKRMRILMKMADGICVFGGEEAVRGVRRLADAGTRLIEWGHKVSFAYVTSEGMDDEALYGLACHMMSTKQRLCSSCQGIYLDTEETGRMEEFCVRFLGLLERAARACGCADAGARAYHTLQIYNRELEQGFGGAKLYRGRGATVSLGKDSGLEPSGIPGYCWVKSLPRTRIVEQLKPYKGYLQTAGLLCAVEQREELSCLLSRAGVVKIRRGEDMSAYYEGESHDGEYPLLRYVKIVDWAPGTEDPERKVFETRAGQSNTSLI